MRVRDAIVALEGLIDGEDAAEDSLAGTLTPIRDLLTLFVRD